MSHNIIDNPNVIAFPPLIYAVPIAVGILLQALFPMNLLPPVWANVLGGLSFILAVILAVLASRTMRQAGTNVNPSQPTTAIVSDGPFRFTRNPLYLSLTLLYSSNFTSGKCTLANADAANYFNHHRARCNCA